jgi:hypothetical protein
MNGPQIPETPNTNNEPLWRVAVAAAYLNLPAPLDRATLSKLGRDCSMVARIKRRPTGVESVQGQPWPTEKAYTRDVLEEVFRLHPATAEAMKRVDR